MIVLTFFNVFLSEEFEVTSDNFDILSGFFKWGSLWVHMEVRNSKENISDEDAIHNNIQ